MPGWKIGAGLLQSFCVLSASDKPSTPPVCVEVGRALKHWNFIGWPWLQEQDIVLALQAMYELAMRSWFEASACQVVTKRLRQRLQSDLLKELCGVQAAWVVQKYVRHNALASSFGYSASKTLYRCAAVVAI